MVHPLRDKAAVSGVGETAYTRGTSKSGLALQLEASLRALDDAGIDLRDVDGVIPYFPGGAIAEDFIANLGPEGSHAVGVHSRWAARLAWPPSRWRRWR